MATCVSATLQIQTKTDSKQPQIGAWWRGLVVLSNVVTMHQTTAQVGWLGLSRSQIYRLYFC